MLLNPIQPGMIWTVNYLGGVYVTPLCISITMRHIATKKYTQIKKKCFLSRYKTRFFMLPL